MEELLQPKDGSPAKIIDSSRSPRNREVNICMEDFVESGPKGRSTSSTIYLFCYACVILKIERGNKIE